MPALGYGRLGADLERMQTVAPGSCMSAGAMPPCFGDVNASYVAADVHLRLGVTPTFALSLVGGYLLGLGVTRRAGPDHGRGARDGEGFSRRRGCDAPDQRLARRPGGDPFRRYSFAFNGTGLAYKSAADTYYGVMGGLVVFTK